MCPLFYKDYVIKDRKVLQGRVCGAFYIHKSAPQGDLKA